MEKYKERDREQHKDTDLRVRGTQRYTQTDGWTDRQMLMHTRWQPEVYV